MKIHILTGHFHPQLHPRALRASELAIELVKRGHEVIVTNLTTVEGADYQDYMKRTGVEVRVISNFVPTIFRKVKSPLLEERKID